MISIIYWMTMNMDYLYLLPISEVVDRLSIRCAVITRWDVSM